MHFFLTFLEDSKRTNKRPFYCEGKEKRKHTVLKTKNHLVEWPLVTLVDTLLLSPKNNSNELQDLADNCQP